MKRLTFWLLAILLVSALALSACGGGGEANESGEASESSENGAAATLDRPAPPAEYASLTNPHDGDQAAADAGKTLYTTNCASCHGESGKGDGPAAASLNPKPQDLADNQTGLSDAYLHWRIAEGGAMEPFKSAMPAWKSILSDDEIWQVVTYIRTLE